MQLSAENQRWLEAFRARHGRAPRILHIGNIANNAYNNARLLNEAGLDCDVICYDYYHIMGCPEWEDADFSSNYGDQFKPDWAAARVKDFKRPRWFAQGPARNCINYLTAKRKMQVTAADYEWSRLEALNGTRVPAKSWLKDKLFLLLIFLPFYFRSIMQRLVYVCVSRGFASKTAAICDAGPIAAFSQSEIVRLLCAWGLISLALVVRIGGYPLLFFVRLFGKNPFKRLEGQDETFAFDARVIKLVKHFTAVFSARKDRLSVSDVSMYRKISYQWRRLFRCYDLVQAYATDPILPMLTEKTPYIGFEHGTLRSHTQCDDPTCRLTSLAYLLADHVFITNGDCLEYARKIGVTRYTPMLHPVDERRIAQIDGRYDELRRELGVRHIFLCTLRHDWAIKGTDQYIRALPDLAKSLGRIFRVIMTRWGADLGKSIALAESLGVADLIFWHEPLSRRKLIETLKSADILFDQIGLPHFGATAPEGIAAGIPVIMSYDPASTEWLVAESAPILTAHNVDEIVAQVLRALDPAWLADYRNRAVKWFDTHHSSRIVVQGHLDVYRTLIPTH